MKFHVSDPCIGASERRLVNQVLDTGRVTMGRQVENLELTFTTLLGSEHAVSASSGTAALHLAMLALGVQPGDEVIVPDLTFIATANAVTYCGATPVFVDVDETWGADPMRVAAAITERTVGIIAVHLYGAPCKVRELCMIAKAHKLWLVEDAAEGLGGTSNGEALGTIGDIGVFSFYGNKMLTTAEGGMLVTNDANIARVARLYRGQGQLETRYAHLVVGYNYRMTDIHAAIGLGQLEHFKLGYERRRELFQEYDSQLEGLLGTPFAQASELAPWLYTGVLPAGIQRPSFMHELAVHGVETRPTFVPLHDQPCYRRADGGVFHCASRIGYRGVSLPTHPNLSDADIKEIVGIVKSTVQKLGGL